MQWLGGVVEGGDGRKGRWVVEKGYVGDAACTVSIAVLCLLPVLRQPMLTLASLASALWLAGSSFAARA
jgi:hypothetical protein